MNSLFNRLFYTPENYNRLAFLDGLRGIAVLLVISVHTINTVGIDKNIFSSIFYAGDRGVQLFFLVSAFTLYTLEVVRRKTEPHPWLSFYIRRLFRIFPLWWLMCGIYFFLRDASLNEFFATAFMYGGFIRYDSNYEIIISGGWSIFIEMCFYLLFPLLFRFTQKGKKYSFGLALFLIFISIVWEKFAAQWGVPTTGKKFIFFHPITHSYCFALGVFLAQLYQEKWKLPKNFCSDKYGIFMIFICGALLLLNHRIAVVGLCMLIISSFAGNRLIERIVNSWILVRMGMCCYGMYFFHFLVLRGLISFSLGSLSESWIVFIIAMPVVILLTYTCANPIYRYFETPFIDLGRKLIRRLETTKVKSIC